jgi:hypothetical protein
LREHLRQPYDSDPPASASDGADGPHCQVPERAEFRAETTCLNPANPAALQRLWAIQHEALNPWYFNSFRRIRAFNIN